MTRGYTPDACWETSELINNNKTIKDLEILEGMPIACRLSSQTFSYFMLRYHILAQNV